jgi:hypothetical protein
VDAEIAARLWLATAVVEESPSPEDISETPTLEYQIPIRQLI